MRVDDLRDELTALAADTDPARDGLDTIVRRGRRRKAMRAAGAATAIVVVAVGVATAVAVTRDDSESTAIVAKPTPGSPTSGPPATSPSSSSTPATNAPPPTQHASADAWVRRHGGVLIGAPTVTSFAVADESIYVVTHQDPRLQRMDRTGALQRERAIEGATVVDARADGVYVHGRTGGTAFLERVDPTTLAATWRAEWPDPGSTAADPIRVAIGTDTVWVGVGSHLERRRSRDGGLMVQLDNDSPVAPALSPDGRVLYTERAPAPDSVVVPLEMRDPGTGAVLARASGPLSLETMPPMQATNGGVWISYRTGSLGSATLYAPADLHAVKTLDRYDGRNTSFGDGVNVATSSTQMWVTGINFIGCADPNSGAWRYVVPGPEGESALAPTRVRADEQMVVADLGVGLAAFDAADLCTDHSER